MKKIVAIIPRKTFPVIKTQLSAVDTYIIDKRNLDDGNIYDESKESTVDSGDLKPIPLAKIEMAVSDKDARKAVEIISKNSSLSSVQGGRIFVSEMEEVIDMQTLDGQQDLESFLKKKSESRQIPKRSRFAPLQKYTLRKLQEIYEENKETLQIDYRIKSFSDFVNYCILKFLPIIEKQLKNPTVIYGYNSSEF